jgi:predicted permease
VTLLTVILFGLYPSWRASRVDSASAIKEGSGSARTASRGRWLPARLLVLFQVVLGVLLLTSAIVFTTNLSALVNRDTGFERGHALLFDVRPGEIGYSGDRLKQFYVNLENRLNQVPGVRSAAVARTRPIRGGGYNSIVRVPGQSTEARTGVHHVSPQFFAALGIPLLAGRGLTDQEVRTGAKVMVISEDVAKQLEISSPLGTRLMEGTTGYTVIGVGRHARYAHMDDEPSAIVYVPFDYTRPSATVIVRTAIPPMTALSAVRNAVYELDPSLPLRDVYTMEQQISRTLQRERLFAWLCGSFGVLALVLCAVGLYGLMSHMTARRIPEMGIRMALGASRAIVLRQVLREGMKLATAGLVLGAPLALYAIRIAGVQELLPEGPMPYEKLGAALGILMVSAIVAVLGPAIRAASVDPMLALRRG